MRKTLLILVVTLLISSFSTANIYAQSSDGTNHEENSQEETTMKAASKKTHAEKKAACEKKQEVITRRLDRLIGMATKMLETFERIAAKVEETGEEGVLNEGAEQKKKAVTDALEEAQGDAEEFSCSNTDPKQALNEFRKNMQVVKSALKEYRTEIKNLIKDRRNKSESERGHDSRDSESSEEEHREERRESEHRNTNEHQNTENRNHSEPTEHMDTSHLEN